MEPVHMIEVLSASPFRLPTGSTVSPATLTARFTAFPPFTSPNPQYAHEGQACTAETTWETRIACGCLGQCKKLLCYIIHGISSGRLLPYVCGKALIPETKSSDSFGNWEYEGVCDDLYFRVMNVFGQESGMIAAMMRDGYKT